MLKRILLLFAAASAVAADGRGSVLVNGSFEDFALPESQWQNPGVGYDGVPLGSTWITGWTVINGPIDYYQSRWQPSNGNRSIDLNGSPSLGGVSQTFTTIPATTYTLGFDLSANPESFGGGPSMRTVRATVAGQSQEFAFDRAQYPNTHSNMMWQHQSMTFTAASASTTLAIASSMPYATWTGPALDNVSVTVASQDPRAPVPPPVTTPPKVHALIVGCEQRKWIGGVVPLDYHGGKDVAIMAKAISSLPRTGQIETYVIDEGTTDPRQGILDRIQQFSNVVGPDDTFVLFVGGHSTSCNFIDLQIDAETKIQYADIATALETAIPSVASKVAIFPGCYSGGAWDIGGIAGPLKAVTNTMVVAGAPYNETAFLLPDSPLLFPLMPWQPFLDITPSGMSALSVTMFNALWRTSWTRSPADQNGDGTITAAELKSFVEVADFYPFWDYQYWSNFSGQNWPILDFEQQYAPFGYHTLLNYTDGAGNTVLAGSSVPETSTLTLLATGLLGLLTYAWRRRRAA